MLKQHALLTFALATSVPLYAAPIESRGLSQASNTATSQVANSATANLNWDLIQKNQQLENQVRALRGKLEEHDNQITQLTAELNNRYADIDQRLELLNKKIDSEPAAEDPHAEATDSQQAPSSNIVPTTQTPEQQQSPPPQQAQNNNSTNNTSSSQSTELEKAAYTIALDAYKQGGAKKAIAPMQNFVKSYPESIYTGNAYFWLAEFNLAIEPPNYVEAKKHYEAVASRYPNSSKAPRSLYQLYSIAKEVNKNTTSANVYKNKLLSTYPNSEEAGFFKKS